MRLQVGVLGVFSPDITHLKRVFNCEIFLFVDTNQVFEDMSTGDC